MKIKNQILLKKFLDKGMYDEALREVDENLKYEPDDSYLNYYKARILYLMEDRCHEAVLPLKKAIHSDRMNCDISILAAEIFTKLKNYSKAEEFYIYILKYYPENPEILANYAYLKAITGDYEMSDKLISKATGKDPQNVRVSVARYKIDKLQGITTRNSKLNDLSGADEISESGEYPGFQNKMSSGLSGFMQLINWKFQIPFLLLNLIPSLGFYHYGRYLEMLLHSVFYVLFAVISFFYAGRQKNII
ncbi:MAG: hypothetical protein JW982_16190 [Spirochaetes bacterium]|nr:hypothetical protein [Spirochaetota bacterium]